MLGVLESEMFNYKKIYKIMRYTIIDSYKALKLLQFKTVGVNK